MAFTDTAAGTSAGAHDPDDISLFLRQLLHRSSSSSSSSSSPHPPLPPPTSTPMIPPSTFPSVGTHAGDHQHQHQHQHNLPCFSSLPISTGHQQIPTLSTFFSDDTLAGVVLTAPASAYLPVSRESNLSSESLSGSAPMRSLDNNEYGEDYDCESEEAAEAGAEEGDLRLPPSRNQSKRSRAAEVHNLSEKRRRSRINEKMKALQNLIPNSNKTDKASMLDEAIEYLKQLQLQVQMLSMRNGLSLHPLCVPGVSGILHPSELSQLGLDFTNKGRPLDVNMPSEFNMLPARSHDVLNPAKQCAPSTRPSVPTVSSVMNSEPSSYGLESCIQDNFGPFQLRNYPQAVCRDQNVLSEQLVPNNTQTKPPEIGVLTTTPLPFDTRDLDVKGHNLLEAPSQQKYGLQEMLP